MPHPDCWDLFCHVVDNYGDAAVSWRLARQLVFDHAQRVRLWIDSPATLARLVPGIDPLRERQTVAGVDVLHWRALALGFVPCDAVVEAFGAPLPDEVLAAMAARPRPPCWIDLEYLSAEPWVESHHGLPSPHPHLPLVRHFFFPGFRPATGGLLRERDVCARRAAFQSDERARQAFLASLGLPPLLPGEDVVSLFAYEHAAVAELLATFAKGPTPVTAIVPEGRLLPAIEACFGRKLAPGSLVRRGALRLAVVPFLPQDEYDRLLWACDFNFVRGEDSFVRAQWAARPFAWHIYPQSDGAHWTKLEAFFAIYAADLGGEARTALAALWQSWNRPQGVGPAWAALQPHREALRQHAVRWAKHLEGLPDLASRLLEFCRKAL